MKMESKAYVESHTNKDMLNMLMCMEQYIETATGRFGYAIARNTRKIKDTCSEYLQVREELITQFGTERTDENDNGTGIIELKIGSDAYNEFEKKLDEYSGIKHDVEIYKIPYEIVPENLTAKGMLDLEWMLIDEQGESE